MSLLALNPFYIQNESDKPNGPCPPVLFAKVKNKRKQLTRSSMSACSIQRANLDANSSLDAVKPTRNDEKRNPN